VLNQKKSASVKKDQVKQEKVMGQRTKNLRNTGVRVDKLLIPKQYLL